MYQSTHVLCFINVFFLLLSFSFLVLIWNFFDIYYLNVGVLIVIIQTSIHRYWPLLGFWRLVMKILLGGIFFKQKFLSCKKKLHFLCETFLTVWHLKIQLTIRVIFFFLSSIGEWCWFYFISAQDSSSSSELCAPTKIGLPRWILSHLLIL